MREAIILAGGKGTRIQHILPGIPKCMAPIHGVPFISYIIRYLQDQNTDHFIFSLGYLHEEISNYLNSKFPDLNKTLVIEQTALGTGGAIIKSLEYANENEVFVLNGDTYFPVSLSAMEDLYNNKGADLVIASTLLKDPHRFGTLSFTLEQKINSFHEKREIESGYINGGCYLVSKRKLLQEKREEAFSFESEILESRVHDWSMFASVQDIPFIDIGIPEDYQRAHTILPDLNTLK